MDAVGLILRSAAVALMLVGAAIDLRTRRIPNAITFGGALLGLILNVVIHQQQGAITSISGWVAGVALLAIPFILGGMGAGDVKLLALAGAWGGPVFALYTLLFGAIGGGAVAIVLLAVNGRLTEISRPLVGALRLQLALVLGPILPRAFALAATDHGTRSASTPVRPRLRFPYGPALAIGAIVTVLVG